MIDRGWKRWYVAHLTCFFSRFTHTASAISCLIQGGSDGMYAVQTYIHTALRLSDLIY